MEMSWITAISLMHSQHIDLFGDIIVKLMNIKLFDLLTCCHYILNPPRMLPFLFMLFNAGKLCALGVWTTSATHPLIVVDGI